MADISTRAIEDILKELKEKQEALRVFRFGAAGSRAKDVKAGKNLRKEVARLQTEISKRQIATKVVQSSTSKKSFALSAK